MYTQLDLIKFVRENVQHPIKRVWNEQELNINLYILEHINGVVLLYVNCTDYAYEETAKF